MARKKRSYRVDYEQDGGGVWIAQIDRSQGVSCVTQGRSLANARRRIREALAAYLNDEVAANDAELVEQIRLSPEMRAAVEAFTNARRAAQEASDRALEVSERSAKLLARAGLSRRDAAELLGLSFQRVHQLVEKKSKGRGGRSAS